MAQRKETARNVEKMKDISALYEYRDIALRIQNEGLALEMKNACTVNECGTAYCIGGYWSYWNERWEPGGTHPSFTERADEWTYAVGDDASLAASRVGYPVVWRVRRMLFGSRQESGPEGLQKLINRINWLIRRHERWAAFERLPDLSKSERRAEYVRLAA